MCTRVRVHVHVHVLAHRRALVGKVGQVHGGLRLDLRARAHTDALALELLDELCVGVKGKGGEGVREREGGWGEGVEGERGGMEEGGAGGVSDGG